METKYNFKNIKDFLRKYEQEDYQIFNSRNTVGDPMKLIYAKDGVTIESCDGMRYLEIFGITKEEYNQLHGYFNILDIKP